MFYDNLKAECDKKDLKVSTIVSECGGAIGSIGGWKKGAMPNSSIVVALSMRLNVTTDYLLTGKEGTNLLSNDEQNLISIYKKLSPINQNRIMERAETLAELQAPTVQYGEEELDEQETIFIEFSTLRVSAGTGEPLIDDSYPDFIEVKKSDLAERANFAVKINGESMMPRFKDGDVVLVRSQPYVNSGEIGIFIIDGDGYIKERGNDRLISLNPEYDDIYFEEGQDIRCKGIVIGTLEEDDFV